MSLEGAMEEERKLIAQILERQKLNTDNTRRDSVRDSRRDRTVSRSTTRGLSRSLSRSTGAGSEAYEDPDDMFLITARDPSLRLTPGYLKTLQEKELAKSARAAGVVPPKPADKVGSDGWPVLHDDDDDKADDSDADSKNPVLSDDERDRIDKKKFAAMSQDWIPSEEEQISDTDSEFEYEDDGSVLPNYSTYSAVAVKASSPTTTSMIPGSSTRKGSVAGASPAPIDGGFSYTGAMSPTLASGNKPDASAEEIQQIQNRRLVRQAKQAEKLDEVLAAERAASNARAIGRDVSDEFMKRVAETASEAGTEVHVDPENFYQSNPKRKEKLQEYAKYKKKLVAPQGPYDGFVVPYSNDQEEKMDSELAQVLNENTKLSEIENNNETQRTVRTITRGNFFAKMSDEGERRAKSFVLCMDFSEEAKNALEWCVGTVLVDGSVLYVLNVIEDDEYKSMQLNGIQPKNNAPSSMLNVGRRAATAPVQGEQRSLSDVQKQRERLRRNNVDQLSKDIVSLLKLTKLQVHVVVQSSHHPIPRHFVVCVVKHLTPTLVIVGSKGTSAVKGVLLGSLSNYLVRKSNSPVMVVKHKLKKLTKKKQANNKVSTMHSLAEARVD